LVTRRNKADWLVKWLGFKSDSIHEKGLIRPINQQESVAWGFATHTKTIFFNRSIIPTIDGKANIVKLCQQYLKISEATNQ
jgi:hypothetical protein